MTWVQTGLGYANLDTIMALAVQPVGSDFYLLALPINVLLEGAYATEADARAAARELVGGVPVADLL